MIAALIRKDFTLFARNKFFAIVTAIGLVFYIGVYYLLPAEVDQNLPVAFYVEGMGNLGDAIPVQDGLSIDTFDSQEALMEAVENGDYQAGLVVTAALMRAVMTGEQATLQIYYAPDIDPEMRDAITSILSARINQAAGSGAAEAGRVSFSTEIVGPPVDEPLALRDLIIPTLLLLILAVEIMALGTLIVEEIESGTARALLTTPLGTAGFFTSKALMSMILSFTQLFIIVAVTGHLTTAPLIVIVALLLGSFLITGIGFLVASISRDMMSVMGWGMLILVVLILPSVTIMFPTVGAGWMDFIPSFYLVDTLHQALNLGASWSDVTTNLLILLVISAGMMTVGSAVLRRRFQ